MIGLEPRIGSLFSGYGGLDMGVQSVVGGSVAWHVEFDDAPSRLLEHRFPGVPNYGDITAVDWALVEPVDVLTGGFPCQDVSLAGLRRGLKDGTRSGLWSEFAIAIDQLRPQLVVIENVRGLLSAEADRGMESDPWGMGNGKRGPALRALGAVLGDLADLGYDTRWTGLRAADAGAPHGRFRVFIVAHPAGQPWRVGNRNDVRAWRGTDRRLEAAGTGSPEDADLAARDQWGESASEQTTERWSRADVGGRSGASVADAAGRGRDGRPQDEVRPPLPRVAAARSGGSAHPAADADGSLAGRGAARDMAGTSRPSEGPRDQRERHGDASGDRRAAARSWGPYAAAIELWESVTGRSAPAPTDLSEAYLKMLRRRLEGRDPRPVGMRGSLAPRHNLSPAFVEWMMGLPAGWITTPEVGLTRPEQLKALGNGVVPQQAALAVATLLSAEVAA